MLGGAIAAGTIHRTTYLPHTTVGAAVAAANPADSATLLAKISKVATVPNVLAAPGSSASGLNLAVDHSRIDFWVNRLTTSMASEFSKSLARMGKYSEMITSKLAAKQMPKDLIYLAMIESEFNPNAKSPVHAVGLWQFMSGTARRFGLTVKGTVDERRDPARATDAAIDYLSDLHDRFGSWYLAAAAYNSGEGTVLHALRKVTGKTTGTDEDFFRILPALPKETQDYVPKLIAAAKVGNSPAEYGLTVDPQGTPVATVATVAAKDPVKPAPQRAKASTPSEKKAHASSTRAKAKRTTKHTTRRKKR
ncbi:MAG TPA: lytic transglycosylase domain-containing protein [Gemmatimonadaceae bacterium]|nr:lytic transglycosylase domain-containing protein [Gemmatimonadaceae bacterium]